jgi:hypothetical protein
MKIEIELAEVEQLRKSNQDLQDKLRVLEGEMKELSPDELKKKAIGLAYRLFENYMASTFRHLGFNVNFRAVSIDYDLDHYIGRTWYNKDDRVKMELHAHVTEAFRSAFLNIGIVPKDEIKQEDIEL